MENIKTLIYCRVSSAKQGEKDCVSLGAQQAKIQEVVGVNNVNTSQIVHETGSAFYAQQPKLKRAIHNLTEGSSIYVYSFDRLSRNMQRFLDLLENLEKRKIKVVSVTEPIDYSQASGRMHLMTVIANAECQSRTISQKVKTAYQFRQQNGLLKPRKRKEYFDTQKQESILMILIGLRSGIMTVKEINMLLKEVVQLDEIFSPLVIDGVKGVPADRPTPGAISFNNIADILYDYGLTPTKMKAPTVRKIYQDNKNLDMGLIEKRLQKLKSIKMKDEKESKEVKEAKETMVMDTVTPSPKPQTNDFNLEELFKQMNLLKEKVEQHLKLL